MYSHVTTLTFTVTYEKIELLKGHLLSFVVSYHLFVFFNNANTVSAEMWVWGFGNHAWYKSLVKSLVFHSWLETFASLVISKTPYSQYLHISMPSHFHEMFLQFFNLLQREFFESISWKRMVYKKLWKKPKIVSSHCTRLSRLAVRCRRKR